MVYMNELTFEVWDFQGVFGDMDGWFSVDELIAPIVRELNLRGYRTTYSCSGHPISGLLPVYDSDPDIDGVEQCGYCESFSSAAYIAFDRDYGMGLITAIPDGFYMDDDNTVIRRRYKAETGFPLLHERLDACESLFQWACALPILAPNRLLCSGK